MKTAICGFTGIYVPACFLAGCSDLFVALGTLAEQGQLFPLVSNLYAKLS